MRRLLREPLLHFFALGLLIFAVHRRVAGDARTIVVTPGVEAELTRRFRDQQGRSPSPKELEAALRVWEQEEALYREAQQERLDRDDPAVRTVLIDKLRMRAALEVERREPTEAQLREWFAAQRARYETPLRYELEWVAFAKEDAKSVSARETFERSVKQGAEPRFLGRPIYGAKLTVEEVKERFGEALAAAVSALPRHAWQRSESAHDLLLVRVNDVAGGLPSFEELRPRLGVDWSADDQQRAVGRVLQKVVDRYRFQARR